MERIKEAIERAKNIQHGQPSGASRSPRSIEKSPSEPGTEIEQIQYSQTRVLELDAAVLEKNRIVAHNKNNAGSRAFDLLRTQVLRKMQEHGWQSVAITSPGPGCGKTTVAINLAMSLAHQTTQTVLLADFDLRKPKVAEYLGIQPEKTLIDYINDESDISDVLVNPGIPRLVILPNLGAADNATELLTAVRMKSLVTDLKTRYHSRILLFDLPPLLSTDDTIAFLPEVDCVLLVVANGATTKSEAEESMRLLQASNVLGTVLNKSEEQTNPYY